MKSVEVTARSVDEAVKEALAQLNTSRDQVEVVVLDEGNKGLFGILAKQARVQVKRKPTVEWKCDVARRFMEGFLQKTDLPARVTVSRRGEHIQVDVFGENLGLLIGRRGKTLDALQYLVGLVVNKEGGDWVRVIVDVEGYRSRREQTLCALARRLANKVAVTGRRIALDPMNAHERLIVHNELSEFEGVETHSEGKDPYRRVIIQAKR